MGTTIKREAPGGATEDAAEGAGEQGGGGFAGMPFASAAAMQTARPFVTFTLPQRLVGGGWGDRDVGDLKFSICEVNTDMEDRASAATGGMRMNFTAMFSELTVISIYKIGGKPTMGNRDKIREWLDAIGPRCRKLVDRAFNSVNSIEEADADSFLESATSGHG